MLNEETAEFGRQRGTVTDVQRTVDKILNMGRVLSYLDQVNPHVDKKYNGADVFMLLSNQLMGWDLEPPENLRSFVSLSCEQVEHPQRSRKPAGHKILSKQRKRAVVACLRMAPLYNLPR